MPNETLKTITNAVRVGLVRRRSISPETSDIPSSSIVQQPPNQRLVRKQRFDRRISRSAPLRDISKDQLEIHAFAAPKTARFHGADGLIATKRQDPGTFPSSKRRSTIDLSPSTSTPSTPTTKKDLLEIPTESKWSTKKKVVVGAVTASILAALITVAIVLGILLTRSTETTSTVVTTTTTTTTTTGTIISAYWSFDNTPTDMYGVYDGQLVNTPTYFSSSAHPYVGYGRTLALTASSSQSVLVATPFLDLSYKSFTIEAWIYPTITTSDRGIFSQCHCSTCTNQCLYFILRSGRLYVGFTLNDLYGSITLSNTGVWYHVAFVYNYQTQQQILYLNGVQDAIRSNVQPYQGKNGSIQIGSTQVYSSTNFFNGYIDNVFVTTRAKSSVEILRDASLMAYYSFDDVTNPNIDSGPNGLNGTAAALISTTGRVNYAVRLVSSASHLQVYGFAQVPYGVYASRPFSVSLWINPSVINTCVFAQFSYAAVSSSWCSNFLGIYSVMGASGQIYLNSVGSLPSMIGPFIAINTWTHISATYSPTNGYSLYVNGILFGTTGATTYTSIGSFAYLFIGYTYYCSSSTAVMNAVYQGSIDEVYIHNRELTQADVSALANP